MSGSRLSGLLVNLGVSLASLALVAGLVEGGLRLAGVRPERGVNPLFSWTGRRGDVWRFEPGARWRTREGRHTVEVNADGFRDRPWGPKPRGHVRILVLGDSVTFGHGQPPDVTYVRQLEQRLADHRPPVQVLNAGIPGWSTYQQRGFYESDGERLDADVVLVGFVLNDVTEVQRGLIELRVDTGLALVRGFNWLAERSAAVAALKRAYAAAAAPQDREVRSVLDLVHRSDAPEVRQALAQTLGELERLHELTSARGAKLGLVLFPFRFQFAGDGLDAPQQALLRFGAERGVPVLDTLPLLRPHGPDAVLMDADHFTPAGHALVADAIADWLAASGLLPPSGPAA